jgi:hypothetical protein
VVGSLRILFWSLDLAILHRSSIHSVCGVCSLYQSRFWYPIRHPSDVASPADYTGVRPNHITNISTQNFIDNTFLRPWRSSGKIPLPIICRLLKGSGTGLNLGRFPKPTPDETPTDRSTPDNHVLILNYGKYNLWISPSGAGLCFYILLQRIFLTLYGRLDKPEG